MWLERWWCGQCKEDIKEQPTSRNLSATAARVLQCTWPVAASWKYFSATGALYAVNVQNKNLCLVKGNEITFSHGIISETHITNIYLNTMHDPIVSYVL
jgi:hypothetical protein